VLAQRRHRLIADHQCIEGVDAAFGHGRRMGGPAVVHDVELRHGDARHVHQVHAGGVDHECGVHTLEGSLARHQLLAATVLLGGGAQQAHTPGQPVAQARQRQRRAQAGGGDQVVSAGVPHLGKRVVLGQ
jgi:hypothetical protein